MERPNEAQVQLACAILKKHIGDYAMAGTDDQRRKAVFSIFAVMGGPGKPDAQYDSVVEQFKDAFKVGGGEQLEEELDTNETGYEWLKDMVTDANPEQTTITLGEEAAAALDIDEGVYALVMEDEDDEDDESVARASLEAMTKAQLHGKYGVSEDQNKDDMIDEILVELAGGDDEE